MKNTDSIKNLMAFVLLIGSGVMVFFLSNWNARQAHTLLLWAADREGRAVFNRLIHEAEVSPRLIFSDPGLLNDIVAADEAVISAGIMQSRKIIASSSLNDFVLDAQLIPVTDSKARIINSELSVFIKQTGPGGNHDRRRQGQGQGLGPRWLRDSGSLNESDSHRMSIYIVFRGPDRSVIMPLLYQKYLWPIAWLGLSLLWLSLLYNQKKVSLWRERMQKDSHLAAIGKMSARLAHEIKNPLGAVRGLAQLLGKKLGLQPELQDLSRQIEKETFRLEELTRSILDFSKPEVLSPVRLNVCAVMADTVNFFKNQHEDCNVVCTFSDQPAYALCDENALRQILVNLLKNASDADKNECRVEIAVKAVGTECQVCIINNGQLEKEVMQHLFEPFFSTRVHGYGLGLPICKKLVEQMNGNLSLQNLPDNKVLAELTLPGDLDDE